MADQLYYMQDKRQYVGNSMYWWAKDCRGYTCDIRNAQVFTMDEALSNSHRETDVLWAVEYIDSRISHHVDVQHCDRSVAAGSVDMETANTSSKRTANSAAA